MSGVQFQSERPATPPETLLVKTTSTSDGDVQHVSLENAGGEIDASNPLVVLSYGKTGDATYQSPRIDVATHTLQIIEYEHHEIHSGSFYRAGFQKDIANGGTAIFAITTPDTTKWLHFRPAVDCEKEATIMLYENPTSVTGGNALTPRNANRNSANASGATVVTDPTINTTGAVVLGNIVLGSKKDIGGNSDAAYEWILRQNETYVIVVTNNSGTANECNIRCQWYEHTNKAA